jgi:hypothetical protein
MYQRSLNIATVAVIVMRLGDGLKHYILGVLTMEIKLLAPEINDTVKGIINGELPPSTSDKEVIQALAQYSIDTGTPITFWRYDDNSRGIVEYTLAQSQMFADTSHWPEPRPRDRITN